MPRNTTDQERLADLQRMADQPNQDRMVYGYDRLQRRFRLMPAKEAADKDLLTTVPEDMIVSGGRSSPLTIHAAGLPCA